MAIGNCKPLKHHQGVHVLRQHWVANVFGEPLVQFVGSVTFLIFRRFLFQLRQKSRSEPFKYEVAGVVPN